MSKIFAENLTVKTAQAYWKRFVESATALLNKYRFDPFFRTEVNIIALQISYALVILGLVGTSFNLLNHDIAAAIVQGIRASAAGGSPNDIAATVVMQTNAIRGQSLAVIIILMVIATILFGYVLARVTLAPTRTALTSQKQFIGNVAHELRTPLSIIKTNTEVALLESDTDSELKHTLMSNIEELDRISEIINNLLSLSELVRPERMGFTSVDLSALTTEVVEKFAPLSKRNGVRITLRKSADTSVWGNSTALMQVVGNIVKNAIVYTREGGEIVITVAPTQHNSVELIVQDSGMGIAEKDLFRIFEPFYRSDPSRERRQGGSGLGLTIVSELVKMHQGKISIRSALGRGTTVSVIIPATRREGGGIHRQRGGSEIAVDFSKHRS